MSGEVLYKKIGKRYIPTFNVERSYDNDLMKPGTFRLTYCYTDCGRRYNYDVTPDTASFVAAAEMFRYEMEQAVLEASKAVEQQDKDYSKRYTKEQKQVIAQCRDLLDKSGVTTPLWWQHRSGWDMSKHIIERMKDAIKQHKDGC
jgi:predicted outer membrane protein